MILSAAVAVKKVAAVTRNVLVITAANPRGAIRRIISVTVPLTRAMERLRTLAAREVVYILFHLLCDKTLGAPWTHAGSETGFFGGIRVAGRRLGDKPGFLAVFGG